VRTAAFQAIDAPRFTRTPLTVVASDRIRCHRLPGGHYRIPEEAIAEFWSEHDRRKQARCLARASTRSALRPPERSRWSTRRPPLGREDARTSRSTTARTLAWRNFAHGSPLPEPPETGTVKRQQCPPREDSTAAWEAI
jgi:hypothetical protein